MYFTYQHLPQLIDPVAFVIGSFAVRWYGLSYLVGFFVIWGLSSYRIKLGENGKAGINQAFIFDFLFIAFMAALIGGRLGYVLFYNLEYFVANPLAIVYPYDQKGLFIGFYGMSYHGSLVAIICAAYVFSKIKKINFLNLADFIMPAVPAGYFFGRLGNFLNGELYGRVTNSSFGMYFQANPQNLRYPSQLLEALLEGVLLFFILWNFRKAKMQKGSLLAIYIFGYGVCRFIAENFREPDQQIGFLFNAISMGQLLSIVMILGGGLLFVLINRKKWYTENI
jgi:phosphatidylglycerol:prolipoprotein diacylglycerol transferase